LIQQLFHVLDGRRFYRRPNWRLDSNLVLSDFERCSVHPTGTREHRAVLFEHTHRAVSFVPTMRKPYDVLAEGLIVKKDRGDRTPLELSRPESRHSTRQSVTCCTKRRHVKARPNPLSWQFSQPRREKCRINPLSSVRDQQLCTNRAIQGCRMGLGVSSQQSAKQACLEVAVMNIRADAPLAVAAIEAIHKGDVESLRRLLEENPGLATARLLASDDCQVMSRSLLHVATDWPGHFPNGAATLAALIAAGAEVNARFAGRHAETPLHWAASSDDVPALDALLDAGADIEAPGAVIGGGTPLADAVGFRQWKAARRLVERGARTALWHVAALGLMDRIEKNFAGERSPARDEVTHAFWSACHGGQLRAAEYLIDRGADLNWIPRWEKRTPLDAARRQSADELVKWLLSRGAKSADELA
jgi:hypothetical protein